MEGLNFKFIKLLAAKASSIVPRINASTILAKDIASWLEKIVDVKLAILTQESEIASCIGDALSVLFNLKGRCIHVLNLRRSSRLRGLCKLHKLESLPL